MLHFIAHCKDKLQEILMISMLFCSKFIGVYVCPVLASLNEPPSPELQLALNFLATFFLVVTLQNNNRHTSARAQKSFPIRNMRPLSIRESSPALYVPIIISL